MPKKVPMRSCVGCGEVKEKRMLIRVIRTPEGAVRPDSTGRANGRGAYLCPDPACVAKAEKRKALNRAFACEIPHEIYEELRRQLERGDPPGGAADE